MPILSFEFEDYLRPWKLKSTKFSNFNLLVGASGVGKTRTLKALETVCNVGLDRLTANGCSWRLVLDFSGHRFDWSAKTTIVSETEFSRTEGNGKYQFEKPTFLNETLAINGVTVIDRSEDRFLFEGETLPRLKNTESAISLLSESPSIKLLVQALERIMFFDDAQQDEIFTLNADQLTQFRHRYPNLEALRQATDIGLITKAYLLQEDYPTQFEALKQDYSEMFETVTDVRLDKIHTLDSAVLIKNPQIGQNWAFLAHKDSITLAIKEIGIENWIISRRMSAGMIRALIHLLEIYLSPPGTVIVVDEFENSLGVNCLPQITDHFLSRADELQFILTSHHPYVINNIEMSRWKVVTRKGATVTILDQADIPALNTQSHQDKFTLLLNLREYEEGMQ